MEARHADQIRQMIGKKVTIYISGKKIERVLRQDSDGLFIRFDNQRVTVRPDTDTLNIMSFLALAPKNEAAIKRMRESRQAEERQNDSGEVETTNVPNSEEPKSRKVVPFRSFRFHQLRRAYVSYFGEIEKKKRHWRKNKLVDGLPP